MNKQVKTKELFSKIPSFLQVDFNAAIYPWELLPNIKNIIKRLLESGIEGYTMLEEGILVGENVKIAKTATIIKPAIIGNNVEIRPGAFIRGDVIICDNCVVGNSSELKNSILLEKVQVPHYNYVGDSVLGAYSHMGAGSICSNLKANKTNVVIHGDAEYATNLRKVGAILGELADVGCGSVLNPGTVVGCNTQIYPLISARGVYPPNCIVKETNLIVEKK